MKNIKILFYTILIFIFSLYGYKLSKSEIYNTNSIFSVHFIDVGQGKSILVKMSDNRNMLIDAGGTKEVVLEYLKNQGITTLDTIIVTHPHSDHISEMPNILNYFNGKIGEFYMPKVSHNSKIFEKMMDSLIYTNVKPIEAKKGIRKTFNEDIYFEILSPSSNNYEELNNWSVVVKLVVKNNSILFTGDIEEVAETEIIKNNIDIDVDVLDVSHHGSNTSSKENFISKVKPKISVISSGKDNKYGHPHSEVIRNLKENNSNIFNTATEGNIVLEFYDNEIKIFTKDEKEYSYK